MNVHVLLIDPNDPYGPCYNQSFNGKLRDDLLNTEIFYTLREAQVMIKAWRVDYNEYRPHSSLDYRTPSDYNRSGLFEAGKLTA